MNGVNSEMRKGDTRREVQAGKGHFAKESEGTNHDRQSPMHFGQAGWIKEKYLFIRYFRNVCSFSQLIAFPGKYSPWTELAGAEHRAANVRPLGHGPQGSPATAAWKGRWPSLTPDGPTVIGKGDISRKAKCAAPSPCQPLSVDGSESQPWLGSTQGLCLSATRLFPQDGF